MNLARHTAFAFLLLALLVGQARASEPSDPYGEAVHIGVQEFSRGNYAESLAAMRRAHRIDPNARTLRGMGLATFEMGDYVKAIDYLQGALSEARKPLTEELRAQVEELILRAEANVATVVLRVTPGDARVRVDEGPPKTLEDGGLLRLNLGTHLLELRAEGRQSQRLRLQLVGGERPELDILLLPTQPASPQRASAPVHDAKRTWGQVLLGLGSASLAGALVSGGLRVKARRHYNSDACAPIRSAECADDADRVQATERAMIGLLAAGGTLSLAGTALVWSSRRRAGADRPTASLRCRAGLGVSCALQF